MNDKQQLAAQDFSFCLRTKICGMKETDNIIDVGAFYPNYMGFIFYKKSPRCFNGIIPEINSSIKKVGVFVDETIANIIEKVTMHDFKAIQLHGDETPDYCEMLRAEVGESIEIIKAFSVGSDFDFQITAAFGTSCDYFLFDTKGKSHGGNGEKFDWGILSSYKSAKPFFLSGGIGVEDIKEIQSLLNKKLPLYGIDFNSKLEIRPGFKDVALVKQAIDQIKTRIIK